MDDVEDINQVNINHPLLDDDEIVTDVEEEDMTDSMVAV